MSLITAIPKAKTKIWSKALDRSIEIRRNLGDFEGHEDGPSVIFTAGIHGNEPSGIFALLEVLKKLKGSDIPFKGNMYAFAGNLSALREGKRYIDMDLNRLWSEQIISGSESALLDNGSVEFNKELPELSEQIHSVLAKNKGPFYLIDLHTTSSETVPFLTIGDTLRNRAFALKFPLPVIVGIEEQLNSTVLNYINELGHICIGVESGQHDSLSSIENHTAIVWQSLVFAGVIDLTDLDDFTSQYEHLAKTTVDGKKVFEIRYRHNIDVGEGFAMLPGFLNFQKVKKGQTLATNIHGNVRSPETGRIFMPKYQVQGNDGFFMVREIRKFWLKVSEIMRKWKIDFFLPLLPGIKWYQSERNSLVINNRIARWYVIEIFHLLGYRKEMKEGNRIIMTKRKYDLEAPE
ncbi:succinylglutamate desuccinylase/aspartoacylase family protein [Reichenbachiella sp. MALMAid0571]|uniref:succinylglutamate desuccinylase/aspartoacylase family protein n=1 Tax=Reichenbachiella sp. MALMAid0571 TaxID=3143939 RepID=UPI0032E05325